MSTFTVEPQIVDVLDRLVAAGHFSSRRDALVEAVTMLDDREAAFADLDRALTRAIASADAGHCIAIDDAERFLTARYRSA
ncbi:MAG: hypothetical protein JO290_01610 [Sphingomonadaceae bacterium]|nr:hypothetical protein [Sphingomonadaceae bacterium]